MKRLIICCDGTWQQPLQTFRDAPAPTNVWKLFNAVAKADGTIPQIALYDNGVGAGDVVDMARGLLGFGLDANIQEAYRFLVANYVAGDEIFLFGFSRGAYTVRSLAGMIRKCGIVRSDRLVHLSEAIALYRDSRHPDHEGPRRFRRERSIDPERSIPIKLIGVWDTVGALGVPDHAFRFRDPRYRFHDTTLTRSVEHAYHALSIDEARKPFRPTLWTSDPAKHQRVEQVWFSGTHSDVGGGRGSFRLSGVSLEWMVSRAKRAGLVFDEETLAQYGAADPLGPMNAIEASALWRLLREPRTGLGLRRVEGKWRRRWVRDPTQSLHRSVLQRWDADAGYRPPGVREWLVRESDTRVRSAMRGGGSHTSARQ